MDEDFKIEMAGALIAVRAAMAQLFADRFSEEANPLELSVAFRDEMQRQFRLGALSGANVGEETRGRLREVAVKYLERLFDQVDELLQAADRSGTPSNTH